MAQSYYVKTDGRMTLNEWIYDKSHGGYFYLEEMGVYVNICTIDGKNTQFQDNGLWIGLEAVNSGN